MQLIVDGVDEGKAGALGFLGGGATGVALALGLFVLTPFALVPAIIAGVFAAIFGTFGLGFLDVDGIHDKIKAEVITKGLEKFDTSFITIDQKLREIIESAFEDRIKAFDKAIRHVIDCYENALNTNEVNSRVSPEQLQANRLWLAQQCQELERIQQQLEGILRLP